MDGESTQAHRPSIEFARAFSNPLPAQLKHFRHPSQRRVQQTAEVVTAPGVPVSGPLADGSDTLGELRLELADSVQMMIQTLLQISPPHLLDPAKEQLAAHTLQLPTPSISALLTTMKNLNYMSANLFLAQPPSSNTPEWQTTSGPMARSELKLDTLAHVGQQLISIDSTSPALEDFDIGEVMQSVGDALGGISAHSGVELVLFHADVGMKHLNVRGDECGVSYALCHVSIALRS